MRVSDRLHMKVEPLRPSEGERVKRRFVVVACANTGPRGAGAHGADEYVLTEEVINVTKVLALTILDYLGVEGA